MIVNAVYKIYDKPTVYLGIGSKFWGDLSAKPGEKAYLITHPMWHFNFKSAYMFRKLRNDLQKRNVELVMLMNTPAELRLSRISGLSGFFVNQNIHVCEQNFKPMKGVEKKYDAVYIAAAKTYKRLKLARLIKKLFIITYFWPDVRNEKGEWDLHAFEPAIKHADFNRDRIEQDEINQILNSSYCGLALSKKEGAMLASLEYQLAGLPVVTTRSVGGRDILLDPAHTIWVKDDAHAVVKAVEHFTKANLSPDEIRERTLNNIDRHRRRFYSVMGYLARKNDVTIEPYSEFRDRIWGAAEGLDAHRIIGDK